MLIRFTKNTPTHHTLEIVRDPSTMLRAGSISEKKEFETKSLMPHDLIHFAYESEAGLKNSFWGLVASGASFTDFDTKEKVSSSMKENKELGQTEMIIGFLTGYLQSPSTMQRTSNTQEEDALDALRNIFSAHGETVPSWINAEFLLKVKDRFRALYGEWSSLPHHKVMEIEWKENF